MVKKILVWGGAAALAAALVGGALFYDATTASAEPVARNPAAADTLESALNDAFAAAHEPGVVIVSLDADGPAAKAGVVRGDIVTKVGDTVVNDVRALTAAVAQKKAGDTVVLTLTRAGVEKTVSVTVADRNGVPYIGVVPGFGVPFGRGMGMVRAFAGGATNVISVTVGSPAEKAGLKAGDVVVAVNGKTGRGNALAQVVAKAKPGDEIAISVQRSGDKVELKATLGENPDKKGAAYLGVTLGGKGRKGMPKGGMHMPFLRRPGAQVAPTNPAAPDSRPAPGGRTAPGNPVTAQPGAFVMAVTAGGPAEAAGVKRGDLITAMDRKSLGSARALVDAVAAHKPGDVVKLTVQRQAETAAIEISVTLSATSDDTGKAYLGVQVGERRMGPGARGAGGMNPSGALDALRERMRQYMPGQPGRNAPGTGRGGLNAPQAPSAPQAPQL